MAVTLDGDKYLPRILSILRAVLGEKRYNIYLFGSRAEGNHNPVSDYDLAIDSPEEENIPLYKIRNELEESTIPYMVDVVDLRTADDKLKNSIKEKGILIWENRQSD